jgi:hypothetical protein
MLGQVPIAVFSVACADCGSNMFDLLLIRSHWGDDEVSEIGVAAHCRGCGLRKSLFDATRNGFDGEHRHLDFLLPREGGPALEYVPMTVQGVRMRVALTYSIPFDELTAYAMEVARKPQDFFDWFSLACAATSQVEWHDIWEYECA